MNIKTLLAKIKKDGYDKLTDDEKAFVDQYDPQKEIDTASAAARRKAEDKAKELQSKLDAANASLAETNEKLEEATKAAEDAKGGSSKEIEALSKKIAKLEAINEKNEKTLKANARSQAIRDAAKAAGLNPAEGVSAAALERLIDLAVGETDGTDADAMKAVLDQFKADNPAMIAAAVKTGANVKGKGGVDEFKGVANPWKTDSFNLTKQIEISQKNPELANTMKVEAGVAPATPAE